MTSRESYVEGLRKLADVLEKYEWVPLPYIRGIIKA